MTVRCSSLLSTLLFSRVNNGRVNFIRVNVSLSRINRTSFSVWWILFNGDLVHYFASSPSSTWPGQRQSTMDIQSRSSIGQRIDYSITFELRLHFTSRTNLSLYLFILWYLFIFSSFDCANYFLLRLLKSPACFPFVRLSTFHQRQKSSSRQCDTCHETSQIHLHFIHSNVDPERRSLFHPCSPSDGFLKR